MTSSWLSRIYHGLRGPHPLHPGVLEGRLKPLSFRPFQPEDLSQCLELYAANEPGRFPAGVMDQYRNCLLEQSSYFLVLEQGDRIAASGGLSYFMRRDFVVLCFGLVHPQLQGEGLGTALLLARLALLAPRVPAYVVIIAAVEKSISFYRRFGFRPIPPWTDQHGQRHPSGALSFTSREIVRCRRLLAAHAISFPADEEKIPFRTKPDFEPGPSSSG